MKKQVLLVGGFLKTRSLAQSLSQKGYEVTIINNKKDDCMSLAEIKTVHVINGDGTKPFILEDANAQNMDIAIALTHRDYDNLVICELCKKKFKVKKTVAVLNDPKKMNFFYKMGIDSVVCATNAITGIIEQQAFVDEMATLIPIGEGRMSIAEVYISDTAPAVGKKIWEVNLPKDVIIGCLMRNEKSMIPRGDTRILAGDVLVLVSAHQQELEAIKELTGRCSI